MFSVEQLKEIESAQFKTS